MTENKFELQSYFILYLLFVRILNLSDSVQEYLNSCFARLCSFNPSDVENTSPQWHAFGSWCASLCRAKFWLVVLLKNMVVYDVLTFLQTMAFVCSTCGKTYSKSRRVIFNRAI
jgi:hypothetical protein